MCVYVCMYVCVCTSVYEICIDHSLTHLVSFYSISAMANNTETQLQLRQCRGRIHIVCMAPCESSIMKLIIELDVYTCTWITQGDSGFPQTFPSSVLAFLIN